MVKLEVWTGLSLICGLYQQMKDDFANRPGRQIRSDFSNGPVQQNRNEFFNGWSGVLKKEDE